MCFFNKGSAPRVRWPVGLGGLRSSAHSRPSTLKTRRHWYSRQFVYKGEHLGVSGEGAEMVLKGADVKRWD